jgi:hypothetical protein
LHSLSCSMPLPGASECSGEIVTFGLLVSYDSLRVQTRPRCWNDGSSPSWLPHHPRERLGNHNFTSLGNSPAFYSTVFYLPLLSRLLLSSTVTGNLPMPAPPNGSQSPVELAYLVRSDILFSAYAHPSYLHCCPCILHRIGYGLFQRSLCSEAIHTYAGCSYFG